MSSLSRAIGGRLKAVLVPRDLGPPTDEAKARERLYPNTGRVEIVRDQASNPTRRKL